jgi:sec-independent protein translocase protein TatC
MPIPFLKKKRPATALTPRASGPLATPGGDDLDEEDGAGKMSFLEHLDELRKRIVNALLSIIVGAVIAFAFIERIYAFIMRPLYERLPAGSSLTYIEPTEAFMLYVKIGLLAGLIIAAPLIMLQLWLFIAPGLYSHEKRFALPFILLSTVCFVGGAAFSHYIVFPWTWTFLASFSTEYTVFMPRIQAVFSLYAMMLVIMGLIFEMPTVVLALARMGLVTAGFLWRHIKYAVLIIFIAAAILTPTGDPWTQTLLAGPMVGLYIISIGLAWAFGKKRRTEAD